MSFMVNPYRFSTGPNTDVLFAVQGFSSGTSLADTSYTSPSITGLTPAATFLFGSVHTDANDPGETSGAGFSIGAIQGSNQRAMFVVSANNTASTSTQRHAFDSQALEIRVAPGSQNYLASGANISGGFSLDPVINQNRRIMAVSFAGSDVQAKVDTIALGTGTSAITVSGVGFQPDAVILFSANVTVSGGATQLFQYTFGFATGDGTQRSVSGAEVHGLAAGSPFQHIHTDCAAGSNSASGSSTKMVVGGFGSDGFTVTPNTSQGSDDLFYLALKFTGRQVKIVDFTTPTSTGNSSITGVGFTPRFALVALTNLEAVDSVAGSTSDLQSGFALAFIGDDEWAASVRIDSAADPTSTASNCKNIALLGASATSTAAISATLVGFTSDGMTLNYSAVQGTGKKGFILFVE